MAAKSDKKVKKPLYRKVNTRTRLVHHNSGGDYRHDRNTAKSASTKMSQGKQRGLDYTPLYKFLLTKVGCKWSEVHSEVSPRIESKEPLFYMVARNTIETKKYVRLGEATYFSGLFVDEHGFLQVVAPEIDETSLEPSCGCCTHTFNGIPFEKEYSGYVART